MPKLPEVETIRRILEPQLKGRQIIGYPETEQFSNILVEQTILYQ